MLLSGKASAKPQVGMGPGWEEPQEQEWEGWWRRQDTALEAAGSSRCCPCGQWEPWKAVVNQVGTDQASRAAARPKGGEND